MEPDFSLTMIGIIATIFSVIFGLAALVVNLRHKKHALQMSQISAANPEGVDEPRREASRQAAPAAAHDDEKDSRSKSVFKQIGPQGTEITPAAQYNEDEYIWE